MENQEIPPYSQPLRLTYSLHSKTMMDSIQSCQRRHCYTDVQLISEGGVVFAHSIVLAGASDYLKELLVNNPDPTIYIHLPGVDYEPLQLLLEVLYGGEELQLTLKQVVALQELGSLLQIDMCNTAAMEQAFFQASQEGVLSMMGSYQPSSVPYSNHTSPSVTPQPSAETSVRRTPARPNTSPNKPVTPNHNNNNQSNSNSNSAKKRKQLVAQQQNVVAPFSLLTNVTASQISQGTNQPGDDQIADLEEPYEAEITVTQPPSKKLSRAAAKELVTCRECHAPFKLIMQLNQHMTREGHLFPPCPECAIPHTTLESLISHVDAHPSETVFTCKYCQKGVLGHDRYLYHMLMCKSLIRGDYVCFICRKSFRNSGSLKTHLLLHTGAKPFPCNFCSASFRQRHHRSHHERSVHLAQGLKEIPAETAEPPTPATSNEIEPSVGPQADGNRPFPCGFCNAAFRQSNHRSYHERVIHGVDRRTRQPKGDTTTRIPANSGSISKVKSLESGAKKRLVRVPMPNGNVPDIGEEEMAEDAEASDNNGELDGSEPEGWIDEEIASDDEQVDEEEAEEEEIEDEADETATKAESEDADFIP